MMNKQQQSRTEAMKRNRCMGPRVVFAAALLTGLLVAVPAAEATVMDVTGAGTLLWGFDGSDVDTDVGGVIALNNQAVTAAGDAARTSLGSDGGGQAQVVTVDTGNGLHPVIAFGGADDTYLSDFGATITGRHQIFIVNRFDENSGQSFNNYVIDGEDGAGRRPTGIRGTTGHYFTGDGGDIITDIPIALGRWQLISLSLGSATPGDDVFAITDGVTPDSFTAVTDSSGHNMTGLTVGGRTETPSAQTRFEGLIAEILVYESDLSPADIAAVEAHLVSKYLIPEPSTLVLIGIGLLGVAARWKR